MWIDGELSASLSDLSPLFKSFTYRWNKAGCLDFTIVSH